ncbi:hypothetical protein LWI29_030670 [Acer saccharum]|uniref:Uncharacterized protein n=1 Tax=Acer saccharum TaxID=4024 RepID=A0AA39VEE7_ACESA|nr:hypothetical protein LWI29_030670 [Acer saccharum]
MQTAEKERETASSSGGPTAIDERATVSLSGEATVSLSGGEQVAGQMENMDYEQFLKVKRNKRNEKVLINVGSRLKKITTIENIICKEGKHKEFMSSCFKQFTNFPQNSLFSARLVHGVLLREITIDGATENELFAKKPFVDFCGDCYKTTSWVEAYSRSIIPVGHPSEWNIPEDVRSRVVYPPPFRAQAGRPKKKRFKSAGSHTLGFVVENRTGLEGRSAEGEQHRRTVRMSSTDSEGEQHRGTTISSGRRTATVGDLDGEGSDGKGRRSRLGDGLPAI